MPDHIIYPKNYLDKFLLVTSEEIRLQTKIKKSRVSTTISKDAQDMLMDFTKKNHNGVIKGPYSYELERAIRFYLHFYDDQF